MISKLKNRLGIILPILLGVFLIYYSYTSFSDSQRQLIYSQFINADYRFILGSLFFGITALISRAYRWKLTLEPLGVRPKFLNQFMCLNIGYIMNLLFPRAGEISRAAFFSKYENIAFDKTLGTIMAERIIDLCCLLALMVAAVFLQYELVQIFIFSNLKTSHILYIGLFLLLTTLCFIYLYRYSKWKWVASIKSRLHGLKEGLQSIWQMKNKRSFIVHTVCIWTSYIAMFYLPIYAIDGTEHLGPSAIVVAFVIGSIAISFTNGGFGTFPFLIASVLSYYHVNETAGTAFGWIVWASQTLLVVILGALSFLFLPLYNRIK